QIQLSIAIEVARGRGQMSVTALTIGQFPSVGFVNFDVPEVIPDHAAKEGRATDREWNAKMDTKAVVHNGETHVNARIEAGSHFGVGPQAKIVIAVLVQIAQRENIA